MKKLILSEVIFSLFLILAFSGCKPDIPNPNFDNPPLTSGANFLLSTATIKPASPPVRIILSPAHTISPSHTLRLTGTPNLAPASATSILARTNTGKTANTPISATPNLASTNTASTTNSPISASTPDRIPTSSRIPSFTPTNIITPTNNPSPTTINMSTPTPTPTPTLIPTPTNTFPNISSPVLRIVNNTKYDMVDIKLNNLKQIYYPYAIISGNYWDFAFTTSEIINYQLGVGFYNSYNFTDVWFRLQGSATITADNKTTITFNNPTIEQLLSGFSSYAYWDGEYWIDIMPYKKIFKFYSSGAWELYDNGTYISSGSVILSSWANYTSSVSFKLFATGPDIIITYPFKDFYFNNGPAGWMTIKYYRRL